jgi:hypothetical protein
VVRHGARGKLHRPRVLTPVEIPGAIDARGHGINDAGQVVGDFWDASGVDRGFVRESTGALTTFTIDIAGQGGVPVTVSGINRSRRIVGWFVDSSQHHHGFVTAR